MAFPFLPVALGLAALGGGLLLLGKKSGPSGPGLPGSGPMDDQRRALIRAEVQRLLAEGKDPTKMEEVARAIEPFGFTAEAAALRARAAHLRMLGSGPSLPGGYVPVGPYMPGSGPGTPTPSIPLPSPPPQVVATVTGDDVRLRAGPSTSTAVLTSLSRGASVTVVNPNAAPPDSAAPMGWAAVLYGTTAGFMSRQYLSTGGTPSAPSPTPSSVTMATVTGDGVRLRSGPSTSTSILASLNRGARVQVTSWNAAPPDSAAPMGWAAVLYGTTAGFMSRQYLALEAPVPSVSGTHALVGNAGHLFRCASPGGCRLRDKPGPMGRAMGLVRSGDTVKLLRHIPGQRGDHRSPGRSGGWAQVSYEGGSGWVPAEWLV